MTDLTNFKEITTLGLNVDNNKTFKKREEAKSDDKIVESIVVSPKLLKHMRLWDDSGPKVTVLPSLRPKGGCAAPHPAHKAPPALIK